ncbi:hypothetical protein RYX36_007077, partial [Vicia faba]
VVAPKKSLKFKTSTDASEAQVIDAMKKISSHIKNSTKFSEAAKHAIQLIQTRGVKSAIAKEHFNKKQKNQLATWEDGTEEATSLKDIAVIVDEGVQLLATNEKNNVIEEAGPFGLDALINESKRKEKVS